MKLLQLHRNDFFTQRGFYEALIKNNPNLDIVDSNSNSVTNAGKILASVFFVRARQLMPGTPFGASVDKDLNKEIKMLNEANILLPNFDKILELLAEAKTMKQIEDKIKNSKFDYFIGNIDLQHLPKFKN